MPNKDANGNLVYSQAEYDHFNYIGEPFCGIVEGIGLTRTEIVVTSRPFNASGTQFMCDIYQVQSIFDMSDMYYYEEPSLSNLDQNQVDKIPDRSDYWRMSNFYQMEYRDDNWKYIHNPVAFVNNVLANILDVVPWAVNSIVVPSQIGYNEGYDAFIDNEITGVKTTANTFINLVKNTWQYHTETPGAKQWSDFKRDITDIKQWEQSTAYAVTMFIPGGAASKVGTASRGGAMLSRLPTSAVIPAANYFPIIRNEAGIFGRNGLIIRNYKIESMYRNGGGGTIFSIKQLENSGNLFRLDLHPHPKTPSIPLLHYHFRLNIGGRTIGSNAPRKIPAKKIIIMGGTATILKGDTAE